jgi:membrane protein DedA with SNARE-associated domain
LKEDAPNKKSFQWSKFAGLATQWAVVLILLVFSGRYLDQLSFVNFKTPIFIWVLPFIFILLSLIRIIKDTGPSRKENQNNSK